MRKYVFVSPPTIQANRINSKLDPVICIVYMEEKPRLVMAHRIKILGPSEVVYSGNHQTIQEILPHTASVVMVTESEIEIMEG